MAVTSRERFLYLEKEQRSNKVFLAEHLAYCKLESDDASNSKKMETVLDLATLVCTGCC